MRQYGILLILHPPAEVLPQHIRLATVQADQQRPRTLHTGILLKVPLLHLLLVIVLPLHIIPLEVLQLRIILAIVHHILQLQRGILLRVLRLPG